MTRRAARYAATMLASIATSRTIPTHLNQPMLASIESSAVRLDAPL